MKKLILIFMIILSTFSYSYDKIGEEYIKGKILSLNRVIENTDEEEKDIREIKEFKVRILEGEKKGEEVLVEFPIYYESAYNIEVNLGQSVILYKESYQEDIDLYYIIDTDKRFDEIILVGIFILLTIGIAKLKGVRALIALGIVVLIVYKIFIPTIVVGMSPILMATICALLASIITIFFMSGICKKSIVAILGSVIGVTFAGLISMYFTKKMGLTGYVSVEALNYAPMLKGIKVKEIISAGVILGSMGAVMDVSMSISSALTELKERDNSITKKELFEAGLRIGQDIIGTMVNTLILAYIGGGILSTLFIYLQKDEFPLIRLLNFESVAVDLLMSFSGSIGILIAVPATAYLSGFFRENEILEVENEEK